MDAPKSSPEGDPVETALLKKSDTQILNARCKIGLTPFRHGRVAQFEIGGPSTSDATVSAKRPHGFLNDFSDPHLVEDVLKDPESQETDYEVYYCNEAGTFSRKEAEEILRLRGIKSFAEEALKHFNLFIFRKDRKNKRKQDGTTAKSTPRNTKRGKTRANAKRKTEEEKGTPPKKCAKM